MTEHTPPSMSPESSRKVHVVSLGCPKNRVDTELMMGRLLQGGFSPTPDPEAADVLLVNTCAFIESSKTESVDAILDLADVKSRNPDARLVVAGCLSQRHAPDLRESMPEVDYFIGTGEYQRLGDLLELPAVKAAQSPAAMGERKGRPQFIADHLHPRYVPPASFSSYLKIAEGCSQGCAFCIIPKLRGVQRSRTIDDLIREARALVETGVVELNLVAQDLTHYGEDLGDPDMLAKLIRELGKVDGLPWVRLMYAYPHNFSDNLIDAIAETDNCLPYVDMPLQHASDNVLKRMNRRTSRLEMETLLDKMRARIDGLVMRTTLLVGHPGETEADFNDLVDFVSAQRFHRVGCFAFSQEEGTASARMPDQLPMMVKRFRSNRIMEIQRGISADHMQAMVGQRLEVLVEGLSDETDLLLQGRYSGQAPEIDGVIYINDAPDNIGRGQLRQVEITEAHDYDLVGHVVG
ncbi:MAG: 30S ribosomal protein S12 methylthiotransferase RimO [Myxococcales bacterium]|nr:30S ribosomal protein S12 methylthiotransferase RimO [Myxococcales bacterium]